MKTGKRRTFSICLSDLPKEKMLKHGNGKIYIPLETWDNDEPDKYDNDFSVAVSLTKDELAMDPRPKRVYVGNGRIWEDKGMAPTTEQEREDLGF